MKTFIYQDEKSHKFWAVEQKDSELHLSWGKVGTHGQSQIKTFADAAAASKAKQKLVNEKTRKGYIDEGETAQPAAVSQPENPVSQAVSPLPESPPMPADVIFTKTIKIYTLLHAFDPILESYSYTMKVYH